LSGKIGPVNFLKFWVLPLWVMVESGLVNGLITYAPSNTRHSCLCTIMRLRQRSHHPTSRCHNPCPMTNKQNKQECHRLPPSTTIASDGFFSWERILSHFGGSDVSRPILCRVLKKHISSEIKSTVCTVRLVDIPVLQIKTALFGLSE